MSDCSQRVQALGHYVTATDVILLNGQEHHVAEVIAVYQQSLDARAAVAPTVAAMKQAIATRNHVEVTRRATDKALRGWVVARFGEGSPAALAFGFHPVVRRTANVATKARANALSTATRKARHTMGSRQRAQVKGVLPTDASTSTATGSTPVATPPGGAPAK